MPQLNQLELVLYSQWFWLLLCLGLIYGLIGHGMLPKIQSTVDEREKRIADDLAAAEAARLAAQETEEAYRERMDASRADAQASLAKAKAKAAKATEKSLADASKRLQTKLDQEAEAIRAARAAAVAELEEVAASLTSDVAAKVAGLNVSKADAARAIKKVMADA